MSFSDITTVWMKYGRHPLRFLRTFLDNRRVFLTGGTPKRGPLTAVFNLSARCDAKCCFCDYWKDAAKRELSAADKIRVVRELADSGVWLLSLCSAEPLLSQDIDQVIGEAKKRRLLVNVSTNGSRLEDKAEMLARSGVDTVTVSLDSHDAAVHDSMRGYPGLFVRAERGIKRLRSLRKGRRPWIAARHLVNARTYFTIGDFLEHWAGKVDEVIFKPVHSSSDGMFNVPADMRPRPGDEGTFREYFKTLLMRYPVMDSPYHRAIPDHLFGAVHDDGTRCFAGTFFTDIDCEGNVRPCTEYGREFGNMLKDGFLDIWASQGIRVFRKEIGKRKKCPGCWGDKFIAGSYVQRVLEMLGGI